MLSVGILVQTPSDPRILSLPGGKEGRRGERREEGGKKGGGVKGKKREMKGHFKGLIHMQSYKIKYTRCILTLAS